MTLGDPIADTIVGTIGKVLDKIIPDPIAQANAKIELTKVLQSGELEAMANDVKLAQMQADTNIQEAKSTNIFIAGWRPFIGWACGAGFVIQFLGPLLQWIAALAGHFITFPTLDNGTLLTTLLGMLGLGGMRTFEKWSKTEGNR